MIDTKTIDSLTLMRFKNYEAHQRWSHLIFNDYFEDKNMEIAMDFARRWAKVMQYLLRHDCKNFKDIITLSAVEANVDNEVTPNHAEKAIDLLAEMWAYGDMLKEWSDTGGKDIITALF